MDNRCKCKLKIHFIGIRKHLDLEAFSDVHLTMKLDCFQKVSQEIVGVSQVPVGSPLSSAIPEFFHQTQVHPTDIRKMQLTSSFQNDVTC